MFFDGIPMEYAQEMGRVLRRLVAAADAAVPGIADTILPPLSRDASRAEWDVLGVSPPMSIRALYSWLGGQNLGRDVKRALEMCLFGGLRVYNSVYGMVMLAQDQLYPVDIGSGVGVGFAASTVGGDMRLYAVDPEGMLVRVCSSGLMPMVSQVGDDREDPLLCWLRTYAERLESGVFGADELFSAGELGPGASPLVAISHFPQSGAGYYEATTRGITVGAAPALVGDSEWAYRITVFEADGGAELPKAQLTTRRWVIDGEDGEHDEVEGPGVIGLYPVVEASVGPSRAKPFRYVSRTLLTESERGTMGGAFKFVPGTIDEPAGEPFWVHVPTFELRVDDVLF